MEFNKRTQLLLLVGASDFQHDCQGSMWSRRVSDSPETSESTLLSEPERNDL